MINKKNIFILLILISIIVIWFFAINNKKITYTETENVIINNLFKIDNEWLFISKFPEITFKWPSIFEKEVYFKKDKDNWYWSFDKKNWNHIYDYSFKWESLTENNLEIVKELYNFSQIKYYNSHNIKNYKYLKNNKYKNNISIKELSDWKSEINCFLFKYCEDDILEKVIKDEWLNIKNTKIINNVRDNPNIYIQNMLYLSSNKNNMKSFIDEIINKWYYEHYFNKDINWNSSYIYIISKKDNQKYLNEIREFNKEFWDFIKFKITDEIFINKESNKKTSLAFLEWIICDDTNNFVWLWELSCIVINKDKLNESIRLLDKYFLYNTENWLKKYFHNDTSNYLTLSDIINDKLIITLDINTNYSSNQKNFISNRIDLINHTEELKNNLYENIKVKSENFDLRDNLKKAENFLIEKNLLTLKNTYKNTKLYEMWKDEFDDMYFSEKNENWNFIKIDQKWIINFLNEDYILNVVYSNSNEIDSFSFDRVLLYWYIIYNIKNKKIYILQN